MNASLWWKIGVLLVEQEEEEEQEMMVSQHAQHHDPGTDSHTVIVIIHLQWQVQMCENYFDMFRQTWKNCFWNLAMN